ncbi:hypothetical protein [Insulibacter thermoxylanivorax]|nr:hypothetical protein [Insulibacter thermoxylanivorax]
MITGRKRRIIVPHRPRHGAGRCGLQHQKQLRGMRAAWADADKTAVHEA